MNKKINPTAIGSFILGAIFLLICSVFVFSSDSWFSKNHKFIVVFTESINGLSVGAPIKLYGVQIGHVTDISVERDMQLNTTLIPVVFEVEQDKIANYINTEKQAWSKDEVNKLIKSGLRMQLQLGSLVTGQLFIEALFLPETAVIVHGHKTSFTEIPSIPSNSAEIQKALTKVLQGTKTVDIVDLISNLQKTIANVAEITGSEQTKSSLAALNSSLLDLQQISSSLKKNIPSLSQNLNKTITHADSLIVNIDRNLNPLLKDTQQIILSSKGALNTLSSAIDDVKSLVNNNSPLNQNLQTALNQITRAARSAKDMMNYLERHPEALLFGKNEETEE